MKKYRILSIKETKAMTARERRDVSQPRSAAVESATKTFPRYHGIPVCLQGESQCGLR